MTEGLGVQIRRLISSWPRELAHSRQRPDVVYERADDLVAVHGVSDVEPTVVTLEDDHVVVCGLDAVARADVAPDALGPVYRRGQQGRVVVPTGRVFVRFAEGETVERRRQDLTSTGFDIEQVLTYAPHAGWVRPATGRVGDALRQLGGLEHVAGLENVEPEMLSERAPR